MTTEALVQLVYISAARAPLTPAALGELVESSRNNNSRHGLTGLLLHADGSFLQLLEGPAAVVDDLFETIAKDRRHFRVLRIFRGEVSGRSFAERALEFSSVASARYKSAGSGTLDSAAVTFTAGATGKVRELITQFRAGRWRQRVDAVATTATVFPWRPRRPSRSFARVRA